MRRLLFALTIVLALAASAARPPAVHAGCAFLVVWHDRAYSAYWSQRTAPPAHPGAPLRGAVEPGCNDTGGPMPGPTPVRARAIAGVPTDVAVLAGREIMIGYGYLPQAVGFPLRRSTLDEMRGCAPGAAVTLSGVARPRPGGINLAEVRSSRPVPLSDHLLVGFFIDAHTRIAGLARHGIPYIADGQRLRIHARFCRVRDSTGPKVVARAIVAAGPIVRATTAEDVLGSHWRGEPGVLHDRTTYVAVAIVVVAMAVALAVLARRRSATRTAG